ncbi:MAG: MFS transporter [Rhodospirillaceae bacterium]|nr:MAG: MFS transporter [Rhodospirillaceae bacterium]
MSPKLILRIFLPFAFGYFLSYLYRAVNAVIAPDLTAELGLGASALGFLTAAYFLSFAAFQLPLGILLDRYGPRRIEAGLLIFAAIGAGLFAWAENVQSLILARALIGFGVSACLMASFKAFVMWFPVNRLPLINGFQMTAGGLGALTATAPVEMALNFTDWRGVFWVLAGLTAFAAVLIYFGVPEREAEDRHSTLKEAFQGVVSVFKSPLFWAVAPWTVMSQATFLALQGLWVGPWFMDVAGLDRHATAQNLFWIAASMTMGFLSWGIVSDRLHKIWGIRPMTVASVGLILAMVCLLLITFQGADQWMGSTLVVWMVFGFCATSGILPYAALSQSFPPHLAGRVNTSLNLLVFVMAFLVQWLIGAVLDLWPTQGAGVYAAAGYQTAFALLLVTQALAAVWYFKRR